MKTRSTFFFLTSNVVRFASSGTYYTVVSEVQRELDGFRYSNYQNQDNGKVNCVLDGSTYHEYNKLTWHTHSLNTSLVQV